VEGLAVIVVVGVGDVTVNEACTVWLVAPEALNVIVQE
jgi:hypothetical protein